MPKQVEFQWVSLLLLSPWLIDSGASNHMTNISNVFNTYFPCFGSDKVRIADGSLSPIVGKDSIKISKIIELKSVHHVPKVSVNLLSVDTRF